MSIQATIGDTANLGSLDVVYAKDNKMVPEIRTNNDVVSLNIRSDFNETKKFSPKKLSAFKRFFRWKSDAEPGTPTSDAPPSPTERTSFKSDTDPANSNSTSSINFYGMGDTSRNVLGPHGKSDLIYVQTPESNSPKRISSFDELYIHSDIKEKDVPDKFCETTIDERITKAVPEVASTRSFIELSSTNNLQEDADVASNITKLMKVSSEICKSPRAQENLEIAAVTGGQEMLSVHEVTDAQSIIAVSDDDECTILTTVAENSLTPTKAFAEVSPGSNQSTSDHVMLTNIVQDKSTVLLSFRDIQFETDASNETILTDTLAPMQDSPVKDDPTSPLSPVGNSVIKSECQTNLNPMWLKKDLADSSARCSMIILRPTSPPSLVESVSEFKVKVTHACQQSVSNNSPAKGAGDSLKVSVGSEISEVTIESQGILEPTGNGSPDCAVTQLARGISKNKTASQNNKLMKGSPTLRTPTIIECQSASANIKKKSIEIISLLSGTKVAAHETLWKGDRHVSSISGNYSSPMNKVLLEDKAIIDQMTNKVTIGVLLAGGDARGKFRKPQAFLAGEIASFDEDSEGESDDFPNEISVALETELFSKRLLSKPFDIEDDYVDEEMDLEKQSEVIMMSLKSARFAKRLDYLKSVSKLNHNRGLTMAGDGNNPSEVYYSKDECCDVEGIKHLSSTSLHSISNTSDRLRETPETRLGSTTESGRSINAATLDALTSPANKTDEEDVTSPDTDKAVESNGSLGPIQNDQDLIPEIHPIPKKSTSSKAPSLLGRLFGPQILICCASDHR